MKRKQFLILAIIFAIMGSIGAYFLVEDLSLEWATTGLRAPQSGTYSEQQIANKVYNDTYGAYQGYVVGRGATTPQSGTYSTSQIANKAYNDTYGAWQMYINEPLNLSYLNLSSTTPYLKMHNTTEEDTDGGRESYWSAQGEQSGGEISTLGKIQISHSGTGDDQKSIFEIYNNDGDDNDTPQRVLTIDESGITRLYGTGSGYGSLYMYSGGYPGVARFQVEATAGGVYFSTVGVPVLFQAGADQNMYFFNGAASGETPWIQFSGFHTGDARRTMKMSIDDAEDNQAIFEGVSSIHMDMGVIPLKVTADPCGTLPEGAIFYNDTANVLCFCDGTNDLKISDGSACF